MGPRIIALLNRIAKGHREEKPLPNYPILPLPAAATDGNWVTIIKTVSINEADRIVEELKRFGISTRIPGKFGIAATWAGADLQNRYPSIPIQVQKRNYGHAKDVLIMKAAPRP